jgi:glycosyltransferase involved in cell wall biosynthesis
MNSSVSLLTLRFRSALWLCHRVEARLRRVSLRTAVALAILFLLSVLSSSHGGETWAACTLVVLSRSHSSKRSFKLAVMGAAALLLLISLHCCLATDIPASDWPAVWSVHHVASILIRYFSAPWHWLFQTVLPPSLAVGLAEWIAVAGIAVALTVLLRRLARPKVLGRSEPLGWTILLFTFGIAIAAALSNIGAHAVATNSFFCQLGIVPFWIALVAYGVQRFRNPPRSRREPASIVWKPLRLVVLLSPWDEELAGRLEAISPWLKAARAEDFSPCVEDYVYAPRDPRNMLSVEQLRNVLLCLACRRYDFLVVSCALAEPPALAAVETEDNLVLTAACYRERREGKPLPRGSRGRMLRLLPAAAGVAVVERGDLGSLGLGHIEAHGAELSVGGGWAWRHSKPTFSAGEERLFSHQPDGRKLIFVLPIFMAVGGVERNTIEMLRRLQDRFAFVLITTERLSLAQGSLHHQLRGLCEAVFDLGEVALPEQHLELLQCLAASYGPSLIWICNGSPWLVQNAQGLRKLFARIPIVDQEVYDTEVGWIQHFDNPGIRSFDRFIAINSPIQRTLMEKYKIDADRIDLIYPAIDADCFEKPQWSDAQREAGREKLGVPAGVRLFAQVGRLTAQKRPLDFLELARQAQEAGLDDHFLLVGDGELAGVCEGYVAAHRLANVHRLRYCQDVSQLFPLLSGLIVMSQYEGLPIVFLEALAMGVPALATDVGEIRRVLEEYGAGQVLDGTGGGPRIFEEFLAWREALERFRHNAREAAPLVRQRFSTENAATCYQRCWQNAWQQKLQEDFGGDDEPLRRRSLAAQSPRRKWAPISVVIPTYNRGPLLIQTLQSCLAHAGGVELELVVVDDGSRDETPRLLREFAAVHENLVWRSIPNGGPGQARNVGASLARHDLILFLGDDIQPQNDEFFRGHAELHAADPHPALAVLGKVVWPDWPESEVNSVMEHIQGVGGEQFGYADMAPYNYFDFCFFYTCNISVKKSIVPDWKSEGFSRAFTAAAYEDVEFAYRMTQRYTKDFRILYTPVPVGTHQHAYSVEGFMKRQFAAGMMAKVFVDLHPEVETRVGAKSIVQALRTPPAAPDDLLLADYISIVEGLKSWARIVEKQHRLGARHWHNDLLRGIFELCYAQGMISAWHGSQNNFALAYRNALDHFLNRLQRAIQNEALGYLPSPIQANL